MKEYAKRICEYINACRKRRKEEWKSENLTEEKEWMNIRKNKRTNK